MSTDADRQIGNVTWPTRRGSRWLVAGVVVLLALAAAYVAPLLITHSGQDTCSFGPVSNAQYRELLAEAKRKQETTWPALVRDDYQASVMLNARFDDLAQGMTSVYERIAAMHAILRALGADYRGSSYVREDPYQAARYGGFLSFDYHLDINRLGFFAPFRRRALIVAGVYAPTDKPQERNPTDPLRYRRGDISFSALFPKLLETYHYRLRSPFGEVCPPAPTPEQAQYLTSRRQ